VVEAAADGASTAAPMVGAILTMLVAFVSLVSLLNRAVAWVGSLVNIEVTFSKLIGYLFWPVAFFLGIPIEDCTKVSQFLGTKLIVNEFVAYADLGAEIREGTISARGSAVATYALCSFANLGSMGIMIGALSGLFPALRAPLAADAFRAMIAGTVACLSTACIASMLYHDLDEPGSGASDECV
jgi:nucleoside permease NupC